LQSVRYEVNVKKMPVQNDFIGHKICKRNEEKLHWVNKGLPKHPQFQLNSCPPVQFMFLAQNGLFHFPFNNRTLDKSGGILQV